MIDKVTLATRLLQRKRPSCWNTAAARNTL